MYAGVHFSCVANDAQRNVQWHPRAETVVTIGLTASVAERHYEDLSC